MDVEKMADAVFKGVEDRIGKALEPILARLEAVEAADPLKALLAGDQLKTLVDLEVAAHFEANPVQHGKDGERGPAGEKGDPGSDGVGMAGAMLDREGVLIITDTKGVPHRLGNVVGRDGVDGLSMVDVTRSYDAETHEMVEAWSVNGAAKSIRYPAGGIRPGGFWTEGMKSYAGQAMTHDGALWIAKRDNGTKPCLENKDDWQLAARKGRDGRDATTVKAPETVKVR